MDAGVGRRGRGRRLLVATGFACAAIIAVEAILLTLPPAPTVPGSTRGPSVPVVSVADVDLIASYATNNLSDTSYLAQTDCACAPVDVEPGQPFSWWIRLANSDPVAHTVVSVALDAPFVLLGADPLPSVSLPPRGNVTISLEIQTPSSTGVYVVTGSVTVS
jgi:hypothetical protein